MKKISIELLKKFLNEDELQKIIEAQKSASIREAWYLSFFNEDEKEEYKKINEYLKKLSKKYGLSLCIYNNTKRAKISKKIYYNEKMEG